VGLNFSKRKFYFFNSSKKSIPHNDLWSPLGNLLGWREKTKSLCGISHHVFYVFHCLVYLLKQHANRYVDFGNHGFHVFHCLVYLLKQHANRYVDFDAISLQTFLLAGVAAEECAYCFQPGDRISNLRTTATKVMSCFVEASCERD